MLFTFLALVSPLDKYTRKLQGKLSVTLILLLISRDWTNI